MTRLRLPIGIQTLRKIREQNCYYVDKTPWIRALLDEGSLFFLSRPRRFGKSLFLDTLKELFEGTEALFRGLHIHEGWDWSARHPVLRLSFGSSHGRLDMAVRFNGNVYLFEFKVVEMTPAGAAMAQLKSRRYADKYRIRDQPIWLIAVEFSKDTRNVVAFEVERG